MTPNGRILGNLKVWHLLDRRPRPGTTSCPICYVRQDPPITVAEAQAVIDIAAKMSTELQAWKCLRVPGRVHLVAPPGTEPGAP